MSEFLLASDLRPGDYLCVKTSGPFGYVIRAVTKSPVDHAFVFLGDGEIAEATVWGCKVDSLSQYAGRYAVVCTDEMTPAQREDVCKAARSFAGREYGWLLIALIALRRLGLRWKWLVRMSSEDRDAAICSELVALSGAAAGLDWLCGEPNAAFVTPADLAQRPGVEPAVI